MDALAYALIALAAYRVATDLAWEDGPGALFARVRGWALQRFGPHHWISEGVSCPICISFWAAPALLLLWPLAPFIVAWLAVAGAAAFLARRT